MCTMSQPIDIMYTDNAVESAIIKDTNTLVHSPVSTYEYAQDQALQEYPGSDRIVYPLRALERFKLTQSLSTGIIYEDTAEHYVYAPGYYLKALKRANKFPYQPNLRHLTLEAGLSPVFSYCNREGDPPKKWMTITSETRVDYKDGKMLVTIHPKRTEDSNPWVFEFLRVQDAAFLANVINDRIQIMKKLQHMQMGQMIYKTGREEVHECLDEDGEVMIIRVALCSNGVYGKQYSHYFEESRKAAEANQSSSPTLFGLHLKRDNKHKETSKAEGRENSKKESRKISKPKVLKMKGADHEVVAA